MATSTQAGVADAYLECGIPRKSSEHNVAGQNKRRGCGKEALHFSFPCMS